MPPSQEVECLLDVMKVCRRVATRTHTRLMLSTCLTQAHFRRQGKKTDVQKQRQIEDLRAKVSGDAPNLQQMLDAATDFVMVRFALQCVRCGNAHIP